MGSKSRGVGARKHSIMNAVITECLGKAKVATKRRRFIPISTQDELPDIKNLHLLSTERRELLIACAKNGASARWETWQKIAGLPRKTLLEHLLEWLLQHGWVMVYEVRRNGDWWPYKVDWQHYSKIRQEFGLPDSGQLSQDLEILFSQLHLMGEGTPDVTACINKLSEIPIQRALSRGNLLLRLLQWKAEQRSGTYRDFALYARNDTKAVTTSEWSWLDDELELINYGIQQHIPLLLLAADIHLYNERGELNLGAFSDFAALSPATINTASSIHGQVTRWRCIENRTSFERVAKQRLPGEAVLWVPGFPPTWWQGAVQQLLAYCPAQLEIACDPDPAGIRIAQQVIRLWQSQGLDARPWRMQINDLESAAQRKSLNTFDIKTLDSLLQDHSLHPEFRLLAQYMQSNQVKAEQEAYL